MTDLPPTIAAVVRTVFLVPHDFTAAAEPLTQLASNLPGGLRTISSAFDDSLHGVIRTLGIPFNYTYSQVHSLHWQRFHMAERIRARGIPNEEEREPAALQNARELFSKYLQGEGRDRVQPSPYVFRNPVQGVTRRGTSGPDSRRRRRCRAVFT